ncbi:MAG: ice-binding family protein [Bacteroidota bacterium]|nr:ice-binding family protein [Bacteroidota bacterium]
MRSSGKIHPAETNSEFSLIGKIIILLLLLQTVCLAQAPPLGTTSTFALFTSIGAIDNVGTTNIAGDMGTDAGAITGFPPGIVIGQVSVSDAATAQAAVDVEAAYNFITTVICDSVIGNVLGNNQTLTPNVYCIGTASTLNNTLILDGLGNSAALFVFKIDGALTTGAFANIVFINSASRGNVYWQINGLFSLGDHSVFGGTILANGAISLLDSSTLDGRGLSRAGAILLSNNLVLGCCGGSTLPVELLSFTAACENQIAVLKWTTVTETNNNFFTIERSLDAVRWENIGTIDAAGNSNTMKSYSFSDEEPFDEVSYYRLKQTDFDGMYSYKHIVTFESCGKNQEELTFYPNPSTGEINLLFKGDQNEFVSLSVFNSFGEEVYRSVKYQQEINLSEKNEGIYFLHLHLVSGDITKTVVIRNQ